jgi:hypothetical protein
MPERLLPREEAILALLGACPAVAQTEPPLERVTFDEAVWRAIERNPTMGEAAQAILRAQGLLDQSKSVFLPSLFGGVGTVVLDAPRGFDGNVTQPRTQSAFNATLSYAFLDAARWAAKSQAADQVGIARISAEETRRLVALGAAEAYLAVVAAQRQREIALRNLDTARALEDYARAARGRREPAQPRAVDPGAGLRRKTARARRAHPAPSPGSPKCRHLRRRSIRCERRSGIEAGRASVGRHVADAAARRPSLRRPAAGRRPGGA